MHYPLCYGSLEPPRTACARGSSRRSRPDSNWDKYWRTYDNVRDLLATQPLGGADATRCLTYHLAVICRSLKTCPDKHGTCLLDCRAALRSLIRDHRTRSRLLFVAQSIRSSHASTISGRGLHRWPHPVYTIMNRLVSCRPRVVDSRTQLSLLGEPQCGGRRRSLIPFPGSLRDYS